uniref:Uncharacterized protein n=1 Tax=Brassica campestris TaxID=3711 RepID=A0A3P5Z980_BRACM|nr:unnamed protein product [Brassica rapa]
MDWLSEEEGDASEMGNCILLSKEVSHWPIFKVQTVEHPLSVRDSLSSLFCLSPHGNGKNNFEA